LGIGDARLASGSGGKSSLHDEDEIDLDMMDSVSLAAVRFDKLLKRLHGGAGSVNESA